MCIWSLVLATRWSKPSRRASRAFPLATLTLQRLQSPLSLLCVAGLALCDSSWRSGNRSLSTATRLRKVGFSLLICDIARQVGVSFKIVDLLTYRLFNIVMAHGTKVFEQSARLDHHSNIFAKIKGNVIIVSSISICNKEM